MKSLLPLYLLAFTALTACNSSNVLDSMGGLDRGGLTTGSIAPASEVDAANLSDDENRTAVTALDAEIGNSPAAEQAAAIVNPPVPEKKPVQTASLRPQKVSPAKSTKYSKIKIYRAKFSDAKPIDFGKRAPKYFSVHGVDVSRWQYDIDWKKLRTRGANFAFIKATEGGDHLDPMFKTNWKKAAEAGIPRSAYHFFYWCRVGEQQADWFIRNVPKEKGSLPPVIDVEWNSHSKSCPKRPSRKVVLNKMRVFMKKLERHYGKKPIIYTTPDFYEDNLQGQFKGYPFWLRSVAEHPRGRYPNRDFVFWQYSGTGLSKGVDTQIDLNVFNGSEKAWRKWLAENTI